MHTTLDVKQATQALEVGVTASFKEKGAAKLKPLHREKVLSLPTSAEQEIRVINARLSPGDTTPRHTHRYPVTVYMLEGTFTLHLDGREPVTIKAGEVFIEPPHVAMTGYNRDPATDANMVLFYVCEPDVPFADPIE